ncbi:inosine monophosphate dehydrogenase [Pleomassaria siparia CBS 279.74]|uniref:Inosine monophosphate dehydrogenase n=1 Tax=Pleomassaria siparia CBS 279.74 TaxID=1314801 RepID=A0A6G1JTP9_9PLEO|nr:inosine monophosphate dehydrogenase [Pleomassaria siparia CBS 279.74]
MAPPPPPPLTTALTTLLNIRHPIMLAGMDQVAGPKLAAAVCNAGGFGTLGGARYTPQMLRDMIAELKEGLDDKNAPFGVDLLIPKVGEGARATNYDYTKGALGELVDIIIESGAKLFVSAVGVPPIWAIEKLHKAGVLYMHVHKACQAGADLICAQGGEAGGHTGDIPTSILTPTCASICAQYTSPPNARARPMRDRRRHKRRPQRRLRAPAGGSAGVWVGTRFIACVESKAPASFKHAVDWEANRQEEIRELSAKGVVPLVWELDRLHQRGELSDEIEDAAALRPIGIVAGSVNKAGQTAAEIVNEMVQETVVALNQAGGFVNAAAKRKKKWLIYKNTFKWKSKNADPWIKQGKDAPFSLSLSLSQSNPIQSNPIQSNPFHSIPS